MSAYPPTRLLLVRHGETDSNAEGRTQGRLDNPLNERGRRQAEALVTLAGRYRPTAIYSSDASRARATAAPLARALDLECIIDHRLAEMDHGALDGLTGQEMRARYPEFLAQWVGEMSADLRIPGGESFREVQERMLAVTREAAGLHRGSAVLFVSHNLALRSLLCDAMGVPLANWRRIRVDLASLSVVEEHADGHRAVVILNEACHLGVE